MDETVPMRLAPTALALLVLAGCAAPPEGGPAWRHDAEDLPLHEGRRTTLRTDLPPDEAQVVLARLDGLEAALDAAFPFLPPGATPPRTIVLGAPARFALHAKEHGLDGPAGAFLCGRGEVFARHELEVAADDVAVPLEPTVRPLASAVFRRRLVLGFGPELTDTWVEDGLAMVFVDVVGSERSAARLQVVARERLLDAYLPLFLGAPPALADVMSARGAQEKKRRGSTALAWAAVRYLLDDAERTRLVVAALRHASGASTDAEWAAARAQLSGLEADFERWLRAALDEELLRAILDAPRPVDRWEASAALRLLANIDLDPDLPDEQRRHAVGATREMMKQDPGPLRFLDAFKGEVERVKAARSQLQAMQRLKALATKELERRSAGYGHPAVEAARQGLGRALQRVLDGV